MFVLILNACLASAPQVCVPRMLPAEMGFDMDSCAEGGDALVESWFIEHPDLTGNGWTCKPLGEVPKLPLDEVAPGVWVHRGADGQLSPENRGQIANLGVVIGDDQVAVIDPGGSREEGEALFAAIRAKTDLPIGPVILTHMHPDHIGGAEVFAEAGGEIIGHHNLGPALEARRDTWDSSIPAQIGADAWAGTVLVDPTRAVAAPETIKLGGTELTLTPVAPAHTNSDLMVRDSRSDTLFTGDLVFRGLTPVVDGSLRGWLDWLTTPPPDAAHIVPGHGPLATSLADAAADETAYLTALRSAVRSALDAGQGLSDAIPAIVAAMAPQKNGWADFAATTARNAAAGYAEMEWE